MKLHSMALQALQYVVNTGGNCTVKIFDSDHAPAGPMLRQDLMPKYMHVVDGRLELTESGRTALSAGTGQ